VKGAGEVTPKKIPLHFYRTRGAGEPVREWLEGLDREDRNAIGQDLMRVQFRWPIGMPLCRNLGGGLWEVRSDLPRHRIGRVIFFFHRGALVILHGFLKKTQRTPDEDIELARRRQKEVER
jgi:phage-related protein